MVQQQNNGRIATIRLDNDKTFRIRKASAKTRAKIGDLRSEWLKDPDNPGNLSPTGTQSLEAQCLVIAECVLDDNGIRIGTKKAEELADDLTGDELDYLTKKILSFSEFDKPIEDVLKNSEPTPAAAPVSE